MLKQSAYKNQQDYVQLRKGVFKLWPLELEISIFFLLLKLSVRVLVQIDFPTFQNYYCDLFLQHCAVCGILVPPLGIELMLPEVEVWSLNHLTTKEVPQTCFFVRTLLMSHLQKTSMTFQGLQLMFSSPLARMFVLLLVLLPKRGKEQSLYFSFLSYKN